MRAKLRIGKVAKALEIRTQFFVVPRVAVAVPVCSRSLLSSSSSWSSSSLSSSSWLSPWSWLFSLWYPLSSSLLSLLLLLPLLVLLMLLSSLQCHCRYSCTYWSHHHSSSRSPYLFLASHERPLSGWGRHDLSTRGIATGFHRSDFPSVRNGTGGRQSESRSHRTTHLFTTQRVRTNQIQRNCNTRHD